MRRKAARDGWSLTADGFQKLLARLDLDPERAEEKYESLLHRLVAFFEWRGSLSPERDAAETIDRVIRRMEGGEEIASVVAYTLGVARLLLVEVFRRQERERRSLAGLSARLMSEAAGEPDPRWTCLDSCLAALPESERNLILDYYGEEAGGHIGTRKALAERHGVAHGVLRARAFRIRERLYECVHACMAGAEGPEPNPPTKAEREP